MLICTVTLGDEGWIEELERQKMLMYVQPLYERMEMTGDKKSVGGWAKWTESHKGQGKER